MPNADDFFHQLQQINGHILDLTAAVNQVNATLTTGFSELVTLGQYTNLALSQNASRTTRSSASLSIYPRTPVSCLTSP
jgi:hypothetical protein